MSLSPTDFVAENVTVFIKYTVKNKPKWLFGYVDKVIEHGVQDGHHYVDVEVQYDDEDDLTYETLWDYDYETNNEDAWRFTNEYKPLVDQVLTTIEERAIEQEVDELDLEDDDEASDDVTDTSYETEDDDDATETETETESHYEDDEPIIVRKKQSFLNAFFATIWTFSPLIATVVYIYHSRDDIANGLRAKYC